MDTTRISATHRLAALALATVLGSTAPVHAQIPTTGGLPPDVVSLEDLNAFRPTGANWRVAGDVRADRNRQHHLEAGAGTGVLVNLPGPGSAQNLFTTWEHGDIELDLEVLVPRGSNSGVYLQGRYEVQILDSWVVQDPTSADMGGIYERWDESRPAGHEGHSPRLNAARAPGIWQTLSIAFRAPRFDELGNKVADARFLRVALNGSVIHENVDVTGPTRAAAFTDEAPLGPLMLQGDHGPVAFRNLRYKTYTGDRSELSELRYTVGLGEFENLAQAEEAPPVADGTSEGLNSTSPPSRISSPSATTE